MPKIRDNYLGEQYVLYTPKV